MTTKRLLAGFLAGVVFGLGLTISGMANPNKVLAFLDVGGDWDPSLAFVMAAAIGINLFLFRWVLRSRKPAFDVIFHMPTSSVVDARLIGGSAIFGLGWGLSGYCPGAAIAAIPSGASSAVLFVGAMGAGMLVYHAYERVTTRRVEPAAAE